MSLRGVRATALLTVVWAGVLAAEVAHADRGGYVIREFHTKLMVRSDAILDVEETLVVNFSDRRHGIYRTIPTNYTDPKGFQYSMGFRLLEVMDDSGRRHETKVTRHRREVRIRIGSADRTVTGEVIYRIRYVIEDALRHFPEHDELYWNATGHDWKAPIERATATVDLPGALPADSLETAAFVGRFGARGGDATGRVTRPGLVEFAAGRSLRPLEGLTIAVAWPHGYVKFPGAFERAKRRVADNWIAAVPLGILALLFRQYRRRGKDPVGPASVVVQYEPPEGISPGLLGTLVDEKVDSRDITATLVDLAIRGFLVIEEREEKRLLGLVTSGTTWFQRVLEKQDEVLRPHEREILAGLFEEADEVSSDDLKHRYYKHLPGIKRTMYRQLEEGGFAEGRPDTRRNSWVGYGVVAGLLTAGAGIAWAASRGAAFPAGAGLPVLAGVATVLMFAVFAPAMPRRTRKGVKMRAWAMGFEEFVERVEKETLERAEERGVFEALLPFAMALGIADRWARKFEGIYDGAPPQWYTGAHFAHGNFSTASMERSLTDSMSSTAGSMASMPRSSGSSGVGGGGFSGGGGGGGGGGSW